MIKTLAVLVNFGEEQLSYLNSIIENLKSFEKYNVYIVVHSNVPIKNDLIDEVKIFKLDNYQLLPLTCRKVFWENRDVYDLFIYGENDHLFEEYHLDLHISYSKILPKNRIPGLIRYEYNDSGKYYPDYHEHFDWDYKSVEIHENKVFAHFRNVHQGTFILNKWQLKKAGAKFDFTRLVDKKPRFLIRIYERLKSVFNIPLENKNLYSVKCRVNTDIYLFGGMKKVICLSEFDKNLIHHLPNVYINGSSGRQKLRADDYKMNEALNLLRKSINKSFKK